MRKINKIIIHCSDSDFKKHDNVETITNWHKLRGFDDIGYHFYINKSGIVYNGRQVETIGAHCKGHNKNSIGICLGGKKQFKLEQFLSAIKLLYTLKAEYKDAEIYLHKELNRLKTCPNFDIDFNKIFEVFK